MSSNDPLYASSESACWNAPYCARPAGKALVRRAQEDDQLDARCFIHRFLWNAIEWRGLSCMQLSIWSKDHSDYIEWCWVGERE